MTVKVKDWRDQIKVGDILISRSGPRTVRKVTYAKDGFLCSVTFTIKKCSWTKLCFTSVGRVDLKQQGFQSSGINIPVSSMKLMDKRINKDIINGSRRLGCCDVKNYY